jgi:hypothetical protein
MLLYTFAVKINGVSNLAENKNSFKVKFENSSKKANSLS